MAEVFDSHLRDLAHPEPNAQRSAIKALTTLGDLRAVPVIIPLLEAKASSVRSQAVQALAKLRHPQAIKPLVRMLQTDITIIRRRAVAALTEFSEPEIIPVLTEALTDPDPKVTQIAAQDLERRGDRRAIPGLIALVDDEERTAPLEQWQKRHAYSLARAAAISALGSLGDPQSIPTLIRALTMEDEIIQDTAIQVLADFGDVAVRQLIEALKSDNEPTRLAVIKTLDAMHCKSAITAVSPLLKDPRARVRGSAARYLGKCGDPQVIPALAETIESTGDDGPNALLALGEPGREAMRAVLYRKPTRSHPILMSIRNLEVRDMRFVPPIIELLFSDVAETRIDAARMLAFFKDEQAVLPLIGALQDTDKFVRQEVALEDRQLSVRSWAKKALKSGIETD